MRKWAVVGGRNNGVLLVSSLGNCLWSGLANQMVKREKRNVTLQFECKRFQEILKCSYTIVNMVFFWELSISSIFRDLLDDRYQNRQAWGDNTL